MPDKPMPTQISRITSAVMSSIPRVDANPRLRLRERPRLRLPRLRRGNAETQRCSSAARLAAGSNSACMSFRLPDSTVDPVIRLPRPRRLRGGIAHNNTKPKISSSSRKFICPSDERDGRHETHSHIKRPSGVGTRAGNYRTVVMQ